MFALFDACEHSFSQVLYLEREEKIKREKGWFMKLSSVLHDIKVKIFTQAIKHSTTIKKE